MKIEPGGYYLLKNGNVVHVRHVVRSVVTGKITHASLDWYDRKGKLLFSEYNVMAQDYAFVKSVFEINCVRRVQPKTPK